MSLSNFSLPFGALTQSAAQPWGVTLSPLQHAGIGGHQLATNTNNLLYSPADHQQQDDGAPPLPGSHYYKNNPYAPPQLHQQQHDATQQQPPSYAAYGNQRPQKGNTYLPPVQATRNTQQQYHAQQQQHHHQQQQQQQHKPLSNNIAYNNAPLADGGGSRTYGENTYNRYPTAAAPLPIPQQQQQPQPQPQQQQQPYYKSYGGAQQQKPQQQPQQHQQQVHTTSTTTSFNTQQQTTKFTTQSQQIFGSKLEAPSAVYGNAETPNAGGNGGAGGGGAFGDDTNNINGAYPERPPGFTRVQAGQGSRTQVHAVLDYDAEEGEEEYYDDDGGGGGGGGGSEATGIDGTKKSTMPTVTPIQGPIFLKNGTVPVVPLFSYPTINNGSFVQIPIWWTALSVALGLDVRGDIIKGVPCIKRYHQLFCPTAGNSYPIDKIERFIDDNKALMRRMYGDFEMNMDPGGPRQPQQQLAKRRKRSFIDEPDIFIPPGAYAAVMPDDGDGIGSHVEEAGESYFGKLHERSKRQTQQNRNSKNSAQQNGPGSNAGSNTGRLDACESKIEIVTPYWASNSAGKIRAIVNTQHFEQAIHQEICSKSQTPRCERDCGCEQKYKWHRLLAYDPDNDCKGIFMDWFLFPSCCVCRCNP